MKNLPILLKAKGGMGIIPPSTHKQARKLGESKFDFGSPTDDYNNYMRLYGRQRITCPCGSVINKSSESRHLKSKLHFKRLHQGALLNKD